MNARHGEYWKRIEPPGHSSGLKTRDTHWGFAISEESDSAGLSEMLAKGLSILVAPLGCLFAFLPGMASPMTSLAVQAGLALAFAAVGFGLFAYAGRGFRTELQVDTARGQFRLGTVNSANRFSLRKTYAAADVESVFLARAKDQRNTAQLHLRLKGSSQKVFVLKASERALVPALERIVEAVRRRSGARGTRTRTTGRFIHVSFS